MRATPISPAMRPNTGWYPAMTCRHAVPFAALALVSLSCSCRTPATSPVVQTVSSDGISVEGEGLTPEAKQEFKPAAKQLLTAAVSQAAVAGIEEVAKKLKLADVAEWRLFSGAYDWGSPDREGDVLTVHLLRHGPADRLPETVELTNDGRPVVRFTRVSAPVERPVAVMTRSRIDGGRLVQADLWLTYGPDRTWHVTRPTETK